MSHTKKFAELRARREAERAAEVKVTWRKVSGLTGGGWSGLGPAGLLVWVALAQDHYRGAHEYGRVVDGERVKGGTRMSLAEAKRAAELLMRRMAGRAPYQSDITTADGRRANSEARQAARYDEPTSDERCRCVYPDKCFCGQVAAATEAPTEAQERSTMSDTITIPTAESLAEGLAEVEAPDKAPYSRIRANGRTLGYVSARKDGVLLDVSAKAVETAPARFKKALDVKGSRACMRVTAKNVKGARALIEWLTKQD